MLIISEIAKSYCFIGSKIKDPDPRAGLRAKLKTRLLSLWGWVLNFIWRGYNTISCYGVCEKRLITTWQSHILNFTS